MNESSMVCRRIRCKWPIVSLLVLACTLASHATSFAADSSPDSPVVKGDSYAGDNPAGEPSADQTESLLGWLNRTLGTRFTLIFLALSLVLVALMIVNVLSVRR